LRRHYASGAPEFSPQNILICASSRANVANEQIFGTYWPKTKLQKVMAVTEVLALFWQSSHR
jgi:hypothetical protein